MTPEIEKLIDRINNKDKSLKDIFLMGQTADPLGVTMLMHTLHQNPDIAMQIENLTIFNTNSANPITYINLPRGLTNLTKLTLKMNSLSSIVIPNDMTSLKTLSISANKLEYFKIPQHIFDNLKSMDLDNNDKLVSIIISNDPPNLNSKNIAATMSTSLIDIEAKFKDLSMVSSNYSGDNILAMEEVEANDTTNAFSSASTEPFAMLYNNSLSAATKFILGNYFNNKFGLKTIPAELTKQMLDDHFNKLTLQIEPNQIDEVVKQVVASKLLRLPDGILINIISMLAPSITKYPSPTQFARESMKFFENVLRNAENDPNTALLIEYKENFKEHMDKIDKLFYSTIMGTIAHLKKESITHAYMTNKGLLSKWEEIKKSSFASAEINDSVVQKGSSARLSVAKKPNF